MQASDFRRGLLLSTATVLGAVTGYGPRAYGQCAPTGGSTYLCSGANAAGQTITANDADVSTDAGFSVNTLDTYAVSITGDGALSYTDENSSPLEGDRGALKIEATGDIAGGNPAGVTVETGGVLNGGRYGILARLVDGNGDLNVTTLAGSDVYGGRYGILGFNNGNGAMEITANGDVTSGLFGIYALNNNVVTGNTSTDLTVATGAGSTVSGATGINAINLGSGFIEITADGDVTGTDQAGISTLNRGTNLRVTTGSGKTVSGDIIGISATNDGSGVTTIDVYGDVTGTASTGILATNGATATDLTVRTAEDTTVGGGQSGIAAINSGSGDIEVTALGDVDGIAGVGIAARNGAIGKDITVTTGAGTTVNGGQNGIYTSNQGSGTTEVTANGDVTGGDNGILATNGASATDLTVTTKGEVEGGDGIRAINSGMGKTTIAVEGDVTGTSSNGIQVEGRGTDLVVTTDEGTTVEGASTGISASNFGTGTTTLTIDSAVTGMTGSGISTNNGGSTTGFSLTTGEDAVVSAIFYGIAARNYGGGSTEVDINANVTVTTGNGLRAVSTGTSLDVTTGEGADITGGEFGSGILAANYGSGPTSITTNGDVTGATTGIYARNTTPNATDLTVRTGEGKTVSGGAFGINAINNGSGALEVIAGGEVHGDTESGIRAGVSTAGTDLSVTANADVSGTEYGIAALSTGSGATEVTANGDVSGDFGITATNNNGTDVTITTAAGTSVAGVTTGVNAAGTGSGATTMNINGDVTGGQIGVAGTSTNGPTFVDIQGDVTATNLYGVFMAAPEATVVVGADSTVTSNGTDANGIAIRSRADETTVVVAGTVNGGAGGAISFEPISPVEQRLELQTGGEINGVVRGSLGTDTFAFAGTGEDTFDLNDIDTGAGTQQHRNFDIFRVESGTWSFNGATTAAFDVTGGTVKGTGTFGGLNVMSGTIAPGDSIGAFTVNGPFRLGPNAVYEAEVDADGNSDTVFVNGLVNLTGATLNVIAADGNYKPSTDYTIIDNDGNDAVTGTFGTVTSNLVFLDPSVDYEGGDGNDVVLTLGRNATLFQDVAATKNQAAVAGALGQFPTDNALYLALLNQNEAGARQAFDALSGEIHASVAGTLADDSRYTREAVLGRLMQASHGDAALGASGPQTAPLYNGKSLQPIEPDHAPLSLWVQGFGAWGDYDSDGNAASVDRDLGGFISGIDADIGGSWRAGLATGASFSSVDADKRYSAADIETYHLGLYVGGMAGGFALRGGGLYAWNDIDTSRAVVFPGFFERQKASYDADTGQIFGEIAYPTQMGGIALEPFGGLAFVSVDTDSFRERGGPSASLRGVDTDQDVGYTTLGLRAATTTQWGSAHVTPHIAVAWQHAFDDVTPNAALAFASNGIGFGVDGVPLAEDSALIDAGLDFALGENATAGVSYSGQFGDGVTDNAVKGRITWLW